MRLLNRVSENIDKIVIPLIVVAAVALLYANYKNGGTVSNVEPPRDNAWFQENVLAKAQPVVVKFGAEWCGPCRALDGVIDEYNQQPGSVEILKVDVDNSPELADHFQVSGIPHVILFDQGKAVAQFTGSRSLGQLTEWIDAHR